MLRFLTSFLTDHTNHPMLAGLFVVAAGFAIAGFALMEITSNGTASGFLVIYGIISAFMGVLGYALLFLGKGIRALQRRYLYS